MRTNEDADLQKHTLHLYAGDYERLGQLFPDVPAALVLRKIVRAHIESVEGKKKSVKVEMTI